MGSSVSGTASKGLIKSGHIQAFQIFSSSNPAKARLNPTPISTAVTDDKGHYTLGLPSGMKDGIMIKVVDGTYIDEATQASKNIADEYPGGMRAAFGNVSGAIKRGDNLSVSPFTEMAVRKSAGLDDNSVDAANHEIEHAFGLDNSAIGVDIRHSKPLDPSVAPAATAKADDKAYTHALAVLSQYEKDNDTSGKKLTGLSDDILTDISGNGGVISATLNSQLQAAELSMDNSGNDKSGSNFGGTPTITVAASSTSGLTGSTTGVTITATVKSSSGSAVANTEVKFAVKSGTGVLSQKSVQTDASGNASVALTSAADSGATPDVVTATAGGVSADGPSIAFITQPTKAILKISTANVPAGTKIGGLNVTVTLPAGVTVAKLADGSTADGVVVSSGAAATAGALAVGNAGVAGQVTIAMITTGGFAGGEFVTINADIAAGTFPTPGQFTVTINGNVIDTTQTTIPNVTASVAATIQ